jgi:riboflavin synthase
MFTGIIEALGIVNSIEKEGTNKTFWISSGISSNLKVDQSLSHNGVCLTVEEVTADTHRVTAVEETLNKSDLGSWKQGDVINLERCLAINGRLDGHIVQGHVDCPATLIEKTDLNGSWIFTFSYPDNFKELVIEKGSIAINGISLTVFNAINNNFSVALIPFTYTHTNLQNIINGDTVNIEFDMIGKYINRYLVSRNTQS